MYDNGRGVAQDDKQAVAWYRKAAEQGDADAQLLLGKMSWAGWHRTISKAVAWTRKAAEQGTSMPKVCWENVPPWPQGGVGRQASGGVVSKKPPSRAMPMRKVCWENVPPWPRVARDDKQVVADPQGRRTGRCRCPRFAGNVPPWPRVAGRHKRWRYFDPQGRRAGQCQCARFAGGECTSMAAGWHRTISKRWRGIENRRAGAIPWPVQSQGDVHQRPWGGAGR